MENADITCRVMPVPRGIPVELPPINVYQINDCDWYAGADADSCIRLYIDKYDGDVDLLDEYGPPTQLTDAALATRLFTDIDYSENPHGTELRRTFREELDRLIAAGVDFPIMFASTEF
jgi:hypothetical protein